MPLMYHPDAKEPVNVAPGCEDTMKNRGWSEEDIRKKQTKKSTKKTELSEEK